MSGRIIETDNNDFKLLSNKDFIIRNNSDFYTTTPADISGCVAYWNFEEGTGSYTFDKVGGLPGSLIGGVVWDLGRYGSAILLNGSNSYIQCNSIGSLLNISSGCGLSVYSWVKSLGSSLSISGPTQPIVGGRIGDNFVLAVGELLGTKPTCISCYMDEYNKQTSDNLVGSNLWNCIATTIQFNAGSPFYPLCGIYFNGSKVSYSSGLYLTGNLYPRPTSAFIGREGRRVLNFNGLLDEIAIYNRALTDVEVNQLYQNGYTKFKSLSSPNNNIKIREVQ